MGHGGLVACGSDERLAVQVGVASQGGSGAPVPRLPVEVDDLDAARARSRGPGFGPEYGPAGEPWGVRRFFVRDPIGPPVNVPMPL
ncbi:glyoxalase [Vulcaniibacterium tengchongense]|uniref:Glyoxalase-like domain-containing protein n=1 Tax=Vulcaniibacterium tengchongense TaxID=1273429 RepID=A0A3N4V9S0_9GAMM|nr:glyoxalase [Vulcaniibacterium tengchongense]RPE79746.1 hypothetical protein EDC50_1572 [Vulcaniibacterium tengchongense]